MKILDSNMSLICLQVVFEGVRGNGTQGDIAIDDITLRFGYCKRNGFYFGVGEEGFLYNVLSYKLFSIS